MRRQKTEDDDDNVQSGGMVGVKLFEPKIRAKEPSKR